MKLNPSLPWTDVNHPWKFGRDISKHFQVIGWMLFFKLAAWRSYLISDWDEMQSQPTLYRDESSLKIWERYIKAFSIIGRMSFSKCLPGGHIGFPIGLKFNPNLPWTEVNHPWKFGKDISKLSGVIGGHCFSKWLPGGHIGFLIGLKCNPNQPWIETNHPWKFGKDISKRSSYWANIVF